MAKILYLRLMAGKNFFQIFLERDCPNIFFLLLNELLLKSDPISDISDHKNDFIFSVDLDLVFPQADSAIAALQLPSQPDVEHG